MRVVRAALACLVSIAATVDAEMPEPSFLQPSLHLLGTSEHGEGDAYAPPYDDLRRDDAASVAFGLDARKMLPHGRLEASGFALVHDPFSSDDRGFSFTGRARGNLRAAEGWRLRFEESPRVQRRTTATLSDFQRNDVWVGLERESLSGPALGIRAGDRRRSVRGHSALGFNRQSLLVSVASVSASRQWRVEAGPQRYSTSVARGWRLLGSAEIVRPIAGITSALRVTWTEPLHDRPGGANAASLMALPAAGPTPTYDLGPPRETQGVSDSAMREGLLGPGLVVDPLQSDEDDWDFGLRKQELIAIGARRFGSSLEVSGELRAQRGRGLDLLAPETGAARLVRQDSLAARLRLRHVLGRHAALLLQGGWHRVNDNRPGLGFSHGIVSFSLELRP